MGNENTMRLNTCSRPHSWDVLESSLERRFTLSKACTCTAVIHCLLEHLGRAGPRDGQSGGTSKGSFLPEKGPRHWCQLPSQRTEPHHLATAQTPCSCSSRRESATGLFSEGHEESLQALQRHEQRIHAAPTGLEEMAGFPDHLQSWPSPDLHLLPHHIQTEFITHCPQLLYLLELFILLNSITLLPVTQDRCLLSSPPCHSVPMPSNLRFWYLSPCLLYGLAWQKKFSSTCYWVQAHASHHTASQ